MKHQNNEKGPLVSIIMNCYNSDRFLREAIESVLAKTYTHWEIIFWDNQSNDQSAEIAKSFHDPRIKYFLAPFHTNLGQARDNAVKQAKGEWLAFLDVDDLWFPKKLEKQIRLIQEAIDPKLGLVYGRALSFGSGETKEREMYSSFYKIKLPEGNILKPLLFQENFITFSSLLILKKAYEAVGGIPFHFIYAEDYYLLAVIAKHYIAAVVQEFVVKYRLHPDNNTNKVGKVALEEMIQIVSMYFQDYPELERKLKWLKATYHVKEYLQEHCPHLLKVLLWLKWNFKENYGHI